MDVLLWFKKYADENPDESKNKVLWVDIFLNQNIDEWIKGKIIRIAGNRWGTFEPIGGGKTISVPPPMVTQHNLLENEIVDVITKLDSTGTKTHIDQLRKNR